MQPDLLANLLREHARRSPDRPFLVHDERIWSYADWAADVAHAASHLTHGNTPLCHAGTALSHLRMAFACNLGRRAYAPTPDPLASPPDSRLARQSALIVRTSGSEGAAKSVCLSNRQLLNAAQASAHRLDLKPGDRWLACLPMYHIGGQIMPWRCLAAGATLVLRERFTTETVAHAFAHQAITHLSLVPAMLDGLLGAGIPPPPTLRVALIGGAALSPSLHDRGRAAGWPLHVSYGMSETCALIATTTPSDGAWTPGLAGFPMAGHDLAIDPEGRIRIRGPQVMLGYADGSGLDVDGWFTTGDLGRLDAHGRLVVLGRADDILVSGGCNIHPLPIEQCLAVCPGVEDVAVTGIPDPVWGERVTALVVGEVAHETLLEHARRQLPSASLPRQIRSVDALPRLATGKLDRVAVRQLAIDGAA